MYGFASAGFNTNMTAQPVQGKRQYPSESDKTLVVQTCILDGRSPVHSFSYFSCTPLQTQITKK